MGVLIGENDMYTDFGMVLTDLSLEMPEVKTKYQTLPLETAVSTCPRSSRGARCTGCARSN